MLEEKCEIYKKAQGKNWILNNIIIEYLECAHKINSLVFFLCRNWSCYRTRKEMSQIAKSNSQYGGKK